MFPKPASGDSEFTQNCRIKMNQLVKRGALIVLEGCDRSGKSTQCKLLVSALEKLGRKALYINFPDRSTSCGKLINLYLLNQQDFNDEGIHLLFTLNRWEAQAKMKRLLAEGHTLIVDRYAYSGVAFSVAKGLDIDWCKSPESGLLKPDLVILLTLTQEALLRRGGFGNERYEIPEMQKNVMKVYETLYDKQFWHKIDADKTEEVLQKELQTLILDIIDSPLPPTVGSLW